MRAHGSTAATRHFDFPRVTAARIAVEHASAKVFFDRVTLCVSAAAAASSSTAGDGAPGRVDYGFKSPGGSTSVFHVAVAADYHPLNAAVQKYQP